MIEVVLLIYKQKNLFVYRRDFVTCKVKKSNFYIDLEGLLNRDDSVKKSKKQNEHLEYLRAGMMKSKNENDALAFILVLFCDPERIRTFDLRLRRALLYPAELRGRLNKKRGMIAHPPRRGGRIRTCDLLVPNQAR